MTDTARRILIEFIEPVVLPRFTMEAGEIWDTRLNKINADQTLLIGGGLAKPHEYKVISR